MANRLRNLQQELTPPPPRRNPRRRAARGYNLNDRQIAIALQEEENNQAAGDARDININDYNENE